MENDYKKRTGIFVIYLKKILEVIQSTTNYKYFRGITYPFEYQN